MGRSMFGVQQLLKPASRLYSTITVRVLLTLAAAGGLGFLYIVSKKFSVPLASVPFVKLVFDTWDLNVYFNSAAWVHEGGRLYREVPSEYPLFANIVFATARVLGNLLHPGPYGFYVVWMAFGGLTYLIAVNAVITRTTELAALAWIAPAPVYFALYRFDIYPAAATLVAFLATRRMAYFQGATWLGVAIALKGYALFLLPAYCVFVSYQRGFAAAIKVAVLALIPILISLVATFSFAGWEGMLFPFKFHAVRTLNGESTYDAINYLFGPSVFSNIFGTGWLAPFLQIAFAFAAAAKRPRTFDELVNASLFAILGSMLFSVFYSPQFVLWILPLTCFSDSVIILVSTILFSWLTYFYFPISWPGNFKLGTYKTAVIAVTIFRLFITFFVGGALFRPRNYARKRSVASPSGLS